MSFNTVGTTARSGLYVGYSEIIILVSIDGTFPYTLLPWCLMVVGGSSGTATYIAMQACKDFGLTEQQTCVVILPDSVRNYMWVRIVSNDMLVMGFGIRRHYAVWWGWEVTLSCYLYSLLFIWTIYLFNMYMCRNHVLFSLSNRLRIIVSLVVHFWLLEFCATWLFWGKLSLTSHYAVLSLTSHYLHIACIAATWL